MPDNKKVQYSPDAARAVIVGNEAGNENPLTYVVDQETGALGESYAGTELRTVEDGSQTLENVSEVNSDGDLTVNVDSSVTVSAPSDASVKLESAQDAWEITSDKRIDIKSNGQSLVYIIKYENVTLGTDMTADITATSAEFALMSDVTKEVVVEVVTQIGTGTLNRALIVGDTVSFSGMVDNQTLKAEFTDTGSAIEGEVSVTTLADGNVPLDPSETYPELSSATINGVTYDVLTSAEAEEIAQEHGYTPTFATDSEIDILFVNDTFSKNTWELIEAVGDADQAANYWAIGDTKVDIGKDNVARTMRIAHMGLFGKALILEQVELENTSQVWNPSSNVDGDNCYNNYSISQMRTTHLQALLAKYSDSLQGVITNTKYKVATNGNNGTLLELEDKLFLPAEREIFSSRSYSRTEEWNALTRFQLYAANDTSAFRKKYKPGATSANYWWLRSPGSGYTGNVCFVSNSGGANNNSAINSYGVSPCFGIGDIS